MSPRNKDFQEVTLEREGQVLLRFASAYGFRNIQNLVQRLKRGRCPYHYVEVMACPSGSSPLRSWQGLGCPWMPPMPHALILCPCAGCLNGGGQLKAPAGPGRQLLQQVEKLYNEVRVQAPEDVAGVRELYAEWLQGEDSARARRLLHTQYHAVEKASSGLSIRW